MTVIDQAMVEANLAIDEIIVNAIDDSVDQLRTQGASDEEVASWLAYYTETLRVWKLEEMAKIKSHLQGVIERDGQSLH